MPAKLDKQKERLIRLAREIAKTGKHISWFYIEQELQFDRREPLAPAALSDPALRTELDKICAEARKRSKDAHRL
jgi:hypothetical protein